MLEVNKVMMAGNLTRDPRVQQTPSGTAVGSFGVALNERYVTRDGESRDQVCFVEVEVWGRQAEACAQFLTKGAPAFVEGRLRHDRWEDKETGQPRSRLFVRADRVQFLAPPPAAGPTQTDAEAALPDGVSGAPRRRPERTASGPRRRQPRS